MKGGRLGVFRLRALGSVLGLGLMASGYCASRRRPQQQEEKNINDNDLAQNSTRRRCRAEEVQVRSLANDRCWPYWDQGLWLR